MCVFSVREFFYREISTAFVFVCTRCSSLPNGVDKNFADRSNLCWLRVAKRRAGHQQPPSIVWKYRERAWFVTR